MNLVSQTIYDYWCRSRTKMSPSGWLTRNAPCCIHRGTTQDKRGRGGLKLDNNTEAITIKCFNCNFVCSFTPGKPLYTKMLSMMKWLLIDDNNINQLKLESLRILSSTGNEIITHTRREIKPIELPECYLLQNELSKYSKHVDFLKSRGFNCDDFPFLVSPDLTYRSRVILPFILQDTIIGYSARSIVPTEKLRYIMRMTTEFVFGLEWVLPDHEWVFVTEGLFDALSVKCLAIMHNEVGDAQAEIINDLQKKIIIVPDLDVSGLAKRDNSLIDTAIDNGWSVSFPLWKEKDINAAYVNYGPLFVVKHLLDQSTNNTTTIRLKQKLLLDELKSKK